MSHPLDALPPRQREVIDLVLDGLDSQAIADRLKMGLGTVNAHRHKALARLNYRNSIQMAYQVGLWDGRNEITNQEILS